MPLGSKLSSSRVPVLEGRSCVIYYLVINVALYKSLIYSFNCELRIYLNMEKKFIDEQPAVFISGWSGAVAAYGITVVFLGLSSLGKLEKPKTHSG